MTTALTENRKPKTEDPPKAAILAAGLGTRLRPLTESVPKTLIPILNRPLLGLILAQVEDAGCVQVAVNTYHLGGKVQDFLAGQPWSFNLSISPEAELLGTGGGLRQLGEILRGGPFLAVNGDIITDLDLAEVYRGHREDAIATLVLHDCPPYNKVWVAEGAVASIGEPPPNGSTARPPLAYTGVQVVGPRMLEYLPAAGPYDLVAAWREALAAGERLAALVVTGHFWQDLGSPAAYLTAHRRLLQGAAPNLGRYFGPLTDPFQGPEVLDEGAHFGPGVCLGARVRLGAGARLQHTVVWEGAYIEPGVVLEDCIVAAGVRVRRSARGQVLV